MSDLLAVLGKYLRTKIAEGDDAGLFQALTVSLLLGGALAYAGIRLTERVYRALFHCDMPVRVTQAQAPRSHAMHVPVPAPAPAPAPKPAPTRPNHTLSEQPRREPTPRTPTTDLLQPFLQLILNMSPEQAESTGWSGVFMNRGSTPVVNPTSDPTVLEIQDPEDGSRRFFARLIGMDAALAELLPAYNFNEGVLLRAVSQSGVARIMPDFAAWVDVTDEGTYHIDFLTDALIRYHGIEGPVEGCMMQPHKFIA
jgi:hypothetical protein